MKLVYYTSAILLFSTRESTELDSLSLSLSLLCVRVCVSVCVCVCSRDLYPIWRPFMSINTYIHHHPSSFRNLFDCTFRSESSKPSLLSVFSSTTPSTPFTILHFTSVITTSTTFDCSMFPAGNRNGLFSSVVLNELWTEDLALNELWAVGWRRRWSRWEHQRASACVCARSLAVEVATVDVAESWS